MRVDIHPDTGVAAARRAGAELEETAVQLQGVVVLDGALVLEAANPREIRRGGPPCGLRMRRGLREARIVLREKPVQHALGLFHRAGLGQSEFDHEPILKRPKEPLDAPPGLR